MCGTFGCSVILVIKLCFGIQLILDVISESLWHSGWFTVQSFRDGKKRENLWNVALVSCDSEIKHWPESAFEVQTPCSQAEKIKTSLVIAWAGEPLGHIRHAFFKQTQPQQASCRAIWNPSKLPQVASPFNKTNLFLEGSQPFWSNNFKMYANIKSSHINLIQWVRTWWTIWWRKKSHSLKLHSFQLQCWWNFNLNHSHHNL